MKLNLSKWSIDPRNGRKIFTTAGGLVFDITDDGIEPTLEAYAKLSLHLDCKNHNHFIDCHHCNGRVQAYNEFKGLVLCERCIAPQYIGVTAESIENPWFDFLAGVLKPKLMPPICEPLLS